MEETNDNSLDTVEGKVCPNCREESLKDIGNWDADKLYKCLICRVWFTESYIRDNTQGLRMNEIPI